MALPAATPEVRELSLYRQFVETMPMVAWEWDTVRGAFTFVSPQIEDIYGLPPQAFEGNSRLLEYVHADDLARLRAAIDAAARDEARRVEHEYRYLDRHGRVRVARAILHGDRGADRPGAFVFGLSTDITAERELQLELHQSHKLEAVGQLAAGIAHEINTPIQFVSDSLYFVRDAIKDVTPLLDAYHKLELDVLGGTDASLAAARAAQELELSSDVEYLREHLPGALERALDGLQRVSRIVRAMKEFAHPDQREMTPTDINQLLESVLTIARNEYKYVADVERDFGEVPQVSCHPGEVSQALLNLVVNAAHAVAERVAGSHDRGRITVRSALCGDGVAITVADTGCGIPDAIRHRIFEPFFTTKEVGRGTGQGLAIVRNVIVDKHGGEIGFDSTLGAGTTFRLRLPIAGRPRGPGAP